MQLLGLLLRENDDQEIAGFRWETKVAKLFQLLKVFRYSFSAYRYFSIALKVVFSLPDRYKIFTSDKMQF